MDWQCNRARYVLGTILLTVCVHGQEPAPLKLTKHIDLAGVDGRIDHFSVDVIGHRLFMSALGNHSLEVLDIASGKRLHSIGDLGSPQGVYYAPPSNRIFVASAGDGSAKIFDGATYAPVITVKFSSNA